MRTASVKKNYIYNTIFQILVILIPLLTTPYVSRVLGVENVGAYSYASAMVTYFTVFAAFGSTVYGQRNIAYFRDDNEKTSQSFWNIVSFRFITGCISIAGYFMYLSCSGAISLLSVIYGLNIFNVIVDITWYFQGIENFKRIVIRNLFIKLLFMVSVFLFVKGEGDTWIYALIVCGSGVAGNMSLWGMAIKNVRLPKSVHPFNGIKEMSLIFLPTIAIQVYVVLDKSMIGWITNSDYENGCYEQAEKIARVALTLVTSISTVILPRIANLFQKDNLEQVKKYIYLSYRFTWLLSLPIMFGLVAVSPVFIPVFLGTGYEKAVGLLQVFSFLVVSVSLSHVTGLSYLIPTKQQNVYTVSVSAAAVVNVIFNLLLIPGMLSAGAAVASILAEGTGCAIQIWYCCYTRQLESREIFRGFGKYLSAGIGMYIVVVMIRAVLDRERGNGVVCLSNMILGGIISYALFLILFQDDFFMENLKKMIKDLKVRIHR